MAKDPAVLFYTQDFLVGTITMNYEQRGKYITLLCLQHQKQKLTLKDLQSILTEEDIEVADKFPKQSDGFYYNLRMYEEAIKRKNYAESRRNNRKKKDDVDISSLRKTYVQRMENENEDVNVNVNVDKNTIVNKNVNETEVDNVIDNVNPISVNLALRQNKIIDESKSSLFDDWNEIED